MSKIHVFYVVFSLAIFSVLASCGKVEAGPTDVVKGWMGKSVEALPDKEYRLAETNGPWMILVTTFSGPNGRNEANALIYELRKNYKLNAYLFDQTFTFDMNKESGKKPQNPYARKTNYKKRGSHQEFAVLVGDFQSLQEKDFDTTLKKIKQCNPECLKKTQFQNNSSQNFSAWRQAVAQKNKEQGPFYLAFGVTNPMLPADFAAQKGTVDEFIVKINNQRPYTLLNCPGRYTVQVATFTGRIEIKQDKINEILEGKRPFNEGKVSELELGEKAAAKLCKILRSKGVEAYEFHDRSSSIVTVGSFDSYGQDLPNGMTELRPEIVQIMNYFQGKPARQGVTQGTISHEPVRFEGIECDVQPTIIEVPRRKK